MMRNSTYLRYFYRRSRLFPALPEKSTNRAPAAAPLSEEELHRNSVQIVTW